jgi:signal transduction histidine kinase
LISRIQSRLPKRQVFLFLLVLAMPCIILIFLGLRMSEQDQLLERKRMEDEHQRRLAQFGSEFLSVLERIKIRTASGAMSDGSAIVGVVDPEGNLTLPWDANPHANARHFLDQTAFGARIQSAEHAELVEHRLDQAMNEYRAALAGSKHPWETAYAGLLLARTLKKTGNQAESRKQYKSVLNSPDELMDEYGIPLALYAAPPLAEMAADRADVLHVLNTLANRSARLSPAALHRMRDVAVRLDGPVLVKAIDRSIAEHQRAEALQSDFPQLLSRLKLADPLWIPYGQPAWLISLAPRNGDGGTGLVAVSVAHARSLLSRSTDAAWIGTERKGEPLGDSFPGLYVTIPSIEPEGDSARTAFLSIMSVVVMALTLFAGYLLWRDVGRGARLAELRSQFVAGVSHELRTPLTSIRMFTESMLMDDEMHSDTRADYLETILRETERLSRLVDNVLRFARIEQGKATYDLRPVSPADVVTRAAGAIRHPLEQSGFRLDVDSGPGLPPVIGDADALQQAILNLLGNAMKYSGASRLIGLRLEREADCAAIRVIDKGIGIAPEEQRHIFESFYRAPTPENLQISGNGLGLTLVDHIAKVHGGSVSVESHLGAGSTFTLRIPFALANDGAGHVAAAGEL